MLITWVEYAIPRFNFCTTVAGYSVKVKESIKWPGTKDEFAKHYEVIIWGSYF
jgi:hypothetical protein